MWIVCSIPEIANSKEGGENWENTPINLDMIATFVKGEDFLFGKIGWQTIEFQDVSEETQLQWYFPDKESRDAEYEMLKSLVTMDSMYLAQRINPVVTISAKHPTSLEV